MGILSKIKKITANILIVILTLIFVYLFLELIFFRFFLSWLPLKTHWFIESPVRSLAQSSKKGTIPHDYIALLGDSHAQGLGDWMLSRNEFLNLDRYSGDIINNRTGIDVVNFALQGSDIVGGVVLNPIHFYEYFNKTYFFRIKSPRQMIVYFYEGNDLNDTLRFLNSRFKPTYDMEQIYDSNYFKKYLDQATHHSQHIQLELKDNLFFANFIRTMIKEFNRDYLGLWDWNNNYINKVHIAGEEVSIVDALQSPALELTDEEINLVVYVFEQCLLYLRNYFPNTPISVVYLPSNLSIYEITSEKVHIETYHDREDIYPKERVRERSDQIYQLVAEMLDRHGFQYVDARPKLREAAKNKLVHGPTDWWHLNKEGQHALAEVVLELIEK